MVVAIKILLLNAFVKKVNYATLMEIGILDREKALKIIIIYLSSIYLSSIKKNGYTINKKRRYGKKKKTNNKQQ